MGETREPGAGLAAAGAEPASDAAAVPSFEQFVSTRSSSLWRSAWMLTGDAQKGEDLLQTALLKAWRRWERIARDGSVEGYVRRCLVTTYTDWWRRAWNRELPSDALPERVATSDTDLVELRQDVLSALATLTRGQRAVVVLRYFDDLTEAQTADALGVSIGTVKSQTARALVALRSSPLLMPPEETP